MPIRISPITAGMLMALMRPTAMGARKAAARTTKRGKKERSA
jgi:hypothetical protein